MKTLLAIMISVTLSNMLVCKGQNLITFKELGLCCETNPEAIQNDPFMLNSMRSALSRDTLICVDDGIAETGWNILTKGWLGNYFPVSSSLVGFIDTVYVRFVNNAGSTNQPLTIDVFDKEYVLKGATQKFIATTGKWIPVAAPHIPFSGPFYIMVKWDHLSADSHYLGYDDNGYYQMKNLERFCDSTGEWTNLVAVAGAIPGEFLVRARASYSPAGILAEPTTELPLVYPNPASDKIYISMQDDPYSLYISSIAGHTLLRRNYKGMPQVMLDVSALPEGVYFLTIHSRNTSITSRLVLIR